MSRIKKEIKKSMIGFIERESVDGDSELSARFIFDEDFIGFQGHFPKKKVLPGVCQIQCVSEMLEGWKKRKVGLEEIVSAKYLLPVSPLEELTIQCSNIKFSDISYTLKASVSKGGEKVSEFKLKVTFGDSIKRDE